jgi:hypothetical protein
MPYVPQIAVSRCLESECICLFRRNCPKCCASWPCTLKLSSDAWRLGHPTSPISCSKSLQKSKPPFRRFFCSTPIISAFLLLCRCLPSPFLLYTNRIRTSKDISRHSNYLLGCYAQRLYPQNSVDSKRAIYLLVLRTTSKNHSNSPSTRFQIASSNVARLFTSWRLRAKGSHNTLRISHETQSRSTSSSLPRFW